MKIHLVAVKVRVVWRTHRGMQSEGPVRKDFHIMSHDRHYVKVLPYRTFRLHPAVCPPYNSDFDGDEMNLHVPQSEEARSEALTLMRVQDQILSPRYGGPIIGGIRDFLTAAYLLTKDGTYVTKDEFTNLA